MKTFISCLLCLLPLGLWAQSEEEIKQAMAAYDYELPIAAIAPAAGDSLLTPLRAQALKAMNRHSEALKEWNSLLISDSTDTKVLIELAECYRLTGRNREAAACYGKAVALRPDNRFFRQQHIRSLLSAEEYLQARDACHGWLERDTVSATGYKFLGQAYEGMVADDPEMLGAAFYAYNAAYRRDSLDAQTVAHIAAIFNDNQQFADAIDVTERYRLTDTTNVDVNRQNAKAYCVLKDYKNAVKRYEALKALGDRSFTTLYYCGISHYGDNWVYGARENLLEAHKKNPNDVNVLYYLAKASSRSSWKDEGLDYMKRALEIATPTDSLVIRLYDGLVDCYRVCPTADREEYIAAAKKLYSMTKKYTLLYRIGFIYDENKDYANAVYYYEKYLAAVPKDKQTPVDEEGNPIPQARTLYQTTKKRVEKIKAEDFFRNGTPDDWYTPKYVPVKKKTVPVDSLKSKK